MTTKDLIVAPDFGSDSEQLKNWLEGNDGHRVLPDGGKQCCPDFACCVPSLGWSADMRRQFVDGGELVRGQMLAYSLAALARLRGVEVDIVGEHGPYLHLQRVH